MSARGIAGIPKLDVGGSNPLARSKPNRSTEPQIAWQRAWGCADQRPMPEPQYYRSGVDGAAARANARWHLRAG